MCLNKSGIVGTWKHRIELMSTLARFYFNFILAENSLLKIDTQTAIHNSTRSTSEFYSI